MAPLPQKQAQKLWTQLQQASSNADDATLWQELQQMQNRHKRQTAIAHVQKPAELQFYNDYHNNRALRNDKDRIMKRLEILLFNAGSTNPYLYWWYMKLLENSARRSTAKWYNILDRVERTTFAPVDAPNVKKWATLLPEIPAFAPGKKPKPILLRMAQEGMSARKPFPAFHVHFQDEL